MAIVNLLARPPQILANRTRRLSNSVSSDSIRPDDPHGCALYGIRVIEDESHNHGTLSQKFGTDRALKFEHFLDHLRVFPDFYQRREALLIPL